MARTNKTKRNRISSSNLFLMELIVALLLFAVSSAACVTIFMKAHTMSEQAVLLNRGTDQLSSLSELIRGCNSVGEMMSVLSMEYPKGEADQAEAEGNHYLSFRIYLDENGISCSEEEASTLLTVDGSFADSIFQADLLCREATGRGPFAKDVICELSVSRYFPSWEGNEPVNSAANEAGED